MVEGIYVVGYSIVLKHMIISIKCGASNIVLPRVSVKVDKTIGEEEEAGWQPISALSLQQLFEIWQFWWQKHPLLLQLCDKDHTQHPK